MVAMRAWALVAGLAGAHAQQPWGAVPNPPDSLSTGDCFEDSRGEVWLTLAYEAGANPSDTSWVVTNIHVAPDRSRSGDRNMPDIDSCLANCPPNTGCSGVWSVLDGGQYRCYWMDIAANPARAGNPQDYEIFIQSGGGTSNIFWRDPSTVGLAGLSIAPAGRPQPSVPCVGAACRSGGAAYMCPSFSCGADSEFLCPIEGCTNPIANNYEPGALNDDGSCVIFTPKPNGDRRLCGRGDVNGDFKVDFTDVLAVLAVFGLPAGGGLEDRDVNQDGVLDSADVLMVLGSFGMTCDGLKPPTICPVLPTPGDATIVYSNLQRHAPMTAQVVCDDPAVQATVDARGPVACTGEWPAAAGQWNNNEPTCEVVGESPPEIDGATLTYSNGLSYPTTATYACGDGTEMSRTLQPDGTWTAAGEIDCAEPILCGPTQEPCLCGLPREPNTYCGTRPRPDGSDGWYASRYGQQPTEAGEKESNLTQLVANAHMLSPRCLLS
jgi:hypothetical protein